MTSEHAALRFASLIARADSDLAKLERDKPGHGAAELARRTKDAAPDASKAACRRAADRVLEVRLSRISYPAVKGPHDGGMLRGPAGGPYVLHRSTPSRALGRTPKVPSSIADRLDAFRRRNVELAYDRCGFRVTGGAGDHNFRVYLMGQDVLPYGNGTRPLGGGLAYADSEMVRTSETYSSRCTWKVQEQYTRIVVPTDWGTRVRLAGLAVLDSLLALDAERLPTTGNVEVYRAVWARQGRGVSLVTERGYIARHTPSGTTYHSTDADPEKALRGLYRKVNAQSIPQPQREAARASRTAQRTLRQAASLARLVERLSRWDLAEIEHVRVTRADSLRAGNCVPGTDAFIDRYGFDGRTSATIGEIAAAVGRRDVTSLGEADLTLARQLAAACLHAVRRDKQARRLVLS